MSLLARGKHHIQWQDSQYLEQIYHVSQKSLYSEGSLFYSGGSLIWQYLSPQAKTISLNALILQECYSQACEVLSSVLNAYLYTKIADSYYGVCRLK